MLAESRKARFSSRFPYRIEKAKLVYIGGILYLRYGSFPQVGMEREVQQEKGMKGSAHAFLRSFDQHPISCRNM